MNFNPLSARVLLDKITIWAVTIAIATLSLVPAAGAITQELQLESQKGYIIKTSFSYDSQTPETIAERGTGKTKVVDSLRVSFYEPTGKAIATYDNIVDGTVKGEYFEFNYDPATEQLQGTIDLGGESAGEMYLKGKADGELSLIRIDESGKEEVIDWIERDRQSDM